MPPVCAGASCCRLRSLRRFCSSHRPWPPLLNALFRELNLRPPGSGPGPHRHPYHEVQFMREGRGIWNMIGQEFEGGAGDILVIKAGEVHNFRAIGETPLVQVDVHLSPPFIQESL